MDNLQKIEAIRKLKNLTDLLDKENPIVKPKDAIKLAKRLVQLMPEEDRPTEITEKQTRAFAGFVNDIHHDIKDNVKNLIGGNDHIVNYELRKEANRGTPRYSNYVGKSDDIKMKLDKFVKFHTSEGAKTPTEYRRMTGFDISPYTLNLRNDGGGIETSVNYMKMFNNSLRGMVDGVFGRYGETTVQQAYAEANMSKPFMDLREYYKRQETYVAARNLFRDMPEFDEGDVRDTIAVDGEGRPLYMPFTNVLRVLNDPQNQQTLQDLQDLKNLQEQTYSPNVNALQETLTRIQNSDEYGDAVMGTGEVKNFELFTLVNEAQEELEQAKAFEDKERRKTRKRLKKGQKLYDPRYGKSYPIEDFFKRIDTTLFFQGGLENLINKIEDEDIIGPALLSDEQLREAFEDDDFFEEDGLNDMLTLLKEERDIAEGAIIRGGQQEKEATEEEIAAEMERTRRLAKEKMDKRDAKMGEKTIKKTEGFFTDIEQRGERVAELFEQEEAQEAARRQAEADTAREFTEKIGIPNISDRVAKQNQEDENRAQMVKGRDLFRQELEDAGAGAIPDLSRDEFSEKYQDDGRMYQGYLNARTAALSKAQGAQKKKEKAVKKKSEEAKRNEEMKRKVEQQKSAVSDVPTPEYDLDDLEALAPDFDEETEYERKIKEKYERDNAQKIMKENRQKSAVSAQEHLGTALHGSFQTDESRRIMRALAGDITELNQKGDDKKALSYLHWYIAHSSTGNHYPIPALDSVLESYGAPTNKDGTVDMNFINGVNGLQITSQPEDADFQFKDENSDRIRSLARNVINARFDADTTRQRLKVPAKLEEREGREPFTSFDIQGQRRQEVEPSQPQLVSAFVGGQRTLGRVDVSDRSRGVRSRISAIGGQVVEVNQRVQPGGVPDFEISHPTGSTYAGILHAAAAGVAPNTGVVYNYLTAGVGGAIIPSNIGSEAPIGPARIGADIAEGLTPNERQTLTIEGALNKLGLGGPQFSGGQAIVGGPRGVPQETGAPPGLNLRQAVMRKEQAEGFKISRKKFEGLAGESDERSERALANLKGRLSEEAFKGEKRRRNLALTKGYQKGLKIDTARKSTLRFLPPRAPRDRRIIQDASGGYHLISRDLSLTVQERIGG